MAMAKRKPDISNITEGLFSTAVDLSLWFVAYFGSVSLPQSSDGQLYRAKREADDFLLHVNYEIIKQGIVEARRRKLLTSGKRGRTSWPAITQAGKRRLGSLLPLYDPVRSWDNRIYLVTYDIPEMKHRQRDLLREYARRIGCAKLQDSVYLTPHDPRDTLKEYIDNHNLTGTIIVADIGKDGSVGDEDLVSLVARVYGLIALNERYEDWIKEYSHHAIDHNGVVRFLPILRDDPQLPFPLLPTWWVGDKAYALVKSYLLP